MSTTETEDLFADIDDDHNLTFCNDDDEDSDSPATQQPEPEETTSSQELLATQIEERQKILEDIAIPLSERFSQVIFDRLQPIKKIQIEKPPDKILTEDEKNLIKTLKSKLAVRKEQDLTLYNPGQRLERKKEEMPEEVRNFCLKKGIVTAHQVYDIMTQVVQSQVQETQIYEKGVLTQLEQDARQQIQQKSIKVVEKAAATVAEAVLMDFDDIEAELTVVKEVELLNNSLGSLSQKLNSSNKLNEILNSSLSQRLKVDLDVSMVNLKATEDEEEIKDEKYGITCKEVLEDEADEDIFKHFPKLEEPCCSKSLQISGNNSVTPARRSNFVLDKVLTKDEKRKVYANKKLSQSNSSFKDPNPIKNSSFRDRLETEDPEKAKTPPTFMGGFGLASGKSVKVNESLTNKLKKRFQLEDEKISAKVQEEFEGKKSDHSVETPKTPAFSGGFGFASGRNVKLKDSTAKKFQNVFQEEDQKISVKLQEEFEGKKKNSSFKPPSTISKTPGPSKTVDPSPLLKFPAKSEPKLEESPATPVSSKSRRTLIQSSSGFVDASLITPEPQSRGFTTSPGFQPIQPTPTFIGFAKASGKSYKTSEGTMKRSAKIFESENQKLDVELESSDFATPAKVKKVRLDFGNSPVSSSPMLMEQFRKGVDHQRTSTPFVSRRKLTESQEISSILQLCSGLDDSSETIVDFQPSPKRRKLENPKSLEKIIDDSLDDEDIDFNEIDFLELSEKQKIPLQIQVQRQQAFKDQILQIEEKSDCDKSKMAGSVFMKKSQKNRTKLKDFLQNSNPVELNRHSINFQNAGKFKFSMVNHVDEEIWKQNVAGIVLADNARLIFDDNSKVGIEEIKTSFLASPGVDSKLLHPNWIENVFKMLVLKFADLESSYQKFEKFELLNPENVLLQMKYRYDREIDRHQRPAIRKIIELDDVPGRRMVLKVLEIYQNLEVGCELELSDGWYSVRTSIDGSLARAVDRGFIKIGTKLVISCAEIVNCLGFDPLDAPDTVRLKIHGNSTRKIVDPSVKLGYCANAKAIKIPLDSVLVDGGVIGRIVVGIVHVYPLIFVDASEGKKEFRSEKLQVRLENKLDRLNFETYENIANQIQEEEFQEMKKRVKELKSKKIKISDLSPDDLFELLEVENDDEEFRSIHKKLSPSMLTALENINLARKDAVKTKILARFNDQKKNVSPLLRMRVVDASNPKNTALVSLWSPTEEMVTCLKPNQIIEIQSSTAGQFTKEIQITAGRCKFIKNGNFEKFIRVETKIPELNKNFFLTHDEIDTALVAIRVDEPNNQNIQKVFCADEDKNFVCLNFFGKIDDYAYGDIVVEGHIFYAKNLQLRVSQASQKIPQLFFNSDSTIFALYPKNKTQESRLAEIKNSIENLTKFVIDCNEMIAEAEKNKENSRRNYSVNVVVHSPATPVNTRQVMSKSLTTKPNHSPIPTNITVKKNLGMRNVGSMSFGFRSKFGK